MKKAIEMLRAVGAWERDIKQRPRHRALPQGRMSIADRAKTVTLVTFSVVEDFDDLNRPHAYIMATTINPPPAGSGKPHKTEARLYNPFGKSSPTWVSCNCGNFRYTWEEFLVPHHSSSKRYVNGPNKGIRNPAKIPALCKHLVRLLTYATRSAKVRKVLFQTPSLRELGLKKNIMKQRGIPATMGKRSRPVVERPALHPKGRPK